MNEVSADIVERCRKGDITALKEVYHAYADRVYRLCLRMMGEHAGAQDAAQEVFLRVFEQASKFSGQSAFSTWVYRVATNYCLNALKSRHRTTAVSISETPEAVLPSGPVPSPLEVVAKADERKSATLLLNALGPDDRAVVVLREIEGLTYKHIAYVLGIPVGTVRSRLHGARQRLRTVAAEIHDEPVN